MHIMHWYFFLFQSKLTSSVGKAMPGSSLSDRRSFFLSSSDDLSDDILSNFKTGVLWLVDSEDDNGGDKGNLVNRNAFGLRDVGVVGAKGRDVVGKTSFRRGDVGDANRAVMVVFKDAFFDLGVCGTTSRPWGDFVSSRDMVPTLLMFGLRQPYGTMCPFGML